MEKRTLLKFAKIEISRRARLDIARRKVSNIKKYKIYLLKHKEVLLKYITLDNIYRNNHIEPSLERFNFNLVDYKLYHASVMVYNAYRQKRLRLKRAIIVCMNVYENCFFVTLTFENLENSINIKQVYNLLKDRFLYFVLNEDYGSQFGRKHFHVVIGSNYSFKCFKLIIREIWGFGFVDIKKVLSSDLSIERISKYITKITNHSIKFTTTKCLLSQGLKFINHPRKEQIVYE